MFEKVTVITLLFLTTLGDIKMESFEVVSGDTCESWYHHNVRVHERKYLVIFIITNTMAKMLSVIFVVMNHHNKPIPRGKKGIGCKVRKVIYYLSYF